MISRYRIKMRAIESGGVVLTKQLEPFSRGKALVVKELNAAAFRSVACQEKLCGSAREFLTKAKKLAFASDRL